MSLSTLRLPDGRILAWAELGSPDGVPVMAFHGTPSSHREWVGASDVLERLGVRFVAPDRPGYGGSTYYKGRRLVDWADDVSRLADHLGWDRFAVVGASGGGPHALVCARLLADRIPVTATIGGVCTLEPGRQVHRLERLGRASRRVPGLGRGVFAASFALRRVAGAHGARLASRTMAPTDQVILGDPTHGEDFLVRTSPTAAAAAAQDMQLFVGDWGFDIEGIPTPLHVWHGTEDRNVPYSQGAYLARTVADGHLHTLSGQGHILFATHPAEILEPLIAGVTRCDR